MASPWHTVNMVNPRTGSLPLAGAACILRPQVRRPGGRCGQCERGDSTSRAFSSVVCSVEWVVRPARSCSVAAQRLCDVQSRVGVRVQSPDSSRARAEAQAVGSLQSIAYRQSLSPSPVRRPRSDVAASPSAFAPFWAYALRARLRRLEQR